MATRLSASLRRSPTERERLAERLAARLDVPFTAAGIIFALLLVAENLTPAGSPLARLWEVATWVLWAGFVLEFVLRLVIAPSTGRFLAQNWWQVVFLVLAFLRFLRALSRGARLARVVSTSVRSTRTATRKLGDRVSWLGAITAIVVLAGSQFLYEYGPGLTYPTAVHDVMLATVSGDPLERRGAVADALELILVLYSTVVFATLAGSLGAYFVERRTEDAGAHEASGMGDDRSSTSVTTE